MDADINFYFDPVCPFAWMTSKWVRQVQAQRDYTVDWRFISLRLINAAVDYDAHFPPEYEAGHAAGLRLLRVAARARAEHGREAMAPLYAAFGAHIFDTAPETDHRSEGHVRERRGTREFAEPILADAGLPLGLADALDDASWDAEIRQETDEALSLTGKDVGTPIIHFEPPTGVAFFGPVISRLPREDSAVELWDHVVGLARFPALPSSSAAFASSPSSLRSVSMPTLSASRRTGTAEAGARRSDPVCEDGAPMSESSIRSYQESVTIRASADALYDLVSDIPRTGSWSPVCKSCWWDDEAEAGQVGAWFTGRNELANRTWQTRSQVAVAERGREFAWIVEGRFVRWGFKMASTETGTTLTESWEFLPDGIAMFAEKFGDEADAQIADRTQQALDGIPQTLAAIKRIAESSAAAAEQGRL